MYKSREGECCYPEYHQGGTTLSTQPEGPARTASHHRDDTQYNSTTRPNSTHWWDRNQHFLKGQALIKLGLAETSLKSRAIFSRLLSRNLQFKVKWAKTNQYQQVCGRKITNMLYYCFKEPHISHLGSAESRILNCENMLLVSLSTSCLYAIFCNIWDKIKAHLF